MIMEYDILCPQELSFEKKIKIKKQEMVGGMGEGEVFEGI